MSAFKKLNKQDAYITTYTAHKSWEVSGSQFSSYGINIVPGVTGAYRDSLKQLYYPTKVTDNDRVEAISHSYDYYNQTTLYNSESRNLTEGYFLLSIPRDLTGTHLRPGAELRFTVNEVQQALYASGTYWVDEYSNDPFQTNQIDILRIDDDEEGSLFISGSEPKEYIGDIIYPHGMVIITHPVYSEFLNNVWNAPVISGIDDPPEEGIQLRKNLVINWQSSQPIFTHNYYCKIRESEFNYTQNPTAKSSSLGTVYDNNGDILSTSGNIYKGDIQDNITGSTFQPYITAIGLYNDANELIAVGKTGQPIPKSTNTDMTLIVKIDI